MQEVVCLNLGRSGAISREYFAEIRLTNGGGIQNKRSNDAARAAVIEADSCEQVTAYLTRTSQQHNLVLAIIGQPPSSAEALADCLSAGVTDFVIAPVSAAELNVRLRRMIYPGASPQCSGGDLLMVGASPKLARVRSRIVQVARTDVPVVVLGETGSGKELVARAIHYQSRRSANPFLPVNCGSLPDHLFENEVFGHARGAYTHAEFGTKGLVGEADGGTLFFDEVDALSPQAQIKLLRFVQYGEYRPLGAPHTLQSNVRCIAAANSDLTRLVEQGRFRDDLLHRLNVVTIEVPPLRERSDDIALLVGHFIAKYRHECRYPAPRLSEAALACLTGYTWPGNVRELESAVRRALIFADSEELRPADFVARADDGMAFAQRCEFSFQEVKARVVAQFEKQFLMNLMRNCAGNVSQASRAARTPRRCLQRLLQKYGLRPAELR